MCQTGQQPCRAERLTLPHAAYGVIVSTSTTQASGAASRVCPGWLSGGTAQRLWCLHSRPRRAEPGPHQHTEVGGRSLKYRSWTVQATRSTGPQKQSFVEHGPCTTTKCDGLQMAHPGGDSLNGLPYRSKTVFDRPAGRLVPQ